MSHDISRAGGPPHDSTGHVFHPGHEELHGITVVVKGRSGKTYIGRYHERTDTGTLLHDVGVHDPGTGSTRADYLARTLEFGIRADHKHLVIADDEVEELRPLADLEP